MSKLSKENEPGDSRDPRIRDYSDRGGYQDRGRGGGGGGYQGSAERGGGYQGSGERGGYQGYFKC